MTNQEILKKAFEKAEKNGWVMPSWYRGKIMMTGHYQEASAIIFSHDFAKAFWGEEETPFRDSASNSLKAWEFHLQRMVLYQNPLEYLENFL